MAIVDPFKSQQKGGIVDPFKEQEEREKREKPTAKREAIPERTLGEAFTDIGAAGLGGVGSLVQLPGQLYGLATGDFSRTGALGAGQDIEEYAKGLKSKALLAKESARSEKVAEAEKQGQFAAFKTALGETITDPAHTLCYYGRWRGCAYFW